MSYLVLARKYRPQTFAEVVGQKHVTQTLVHSIEAGRVAHAMLFSGPRGTGKTTIARIMAKAMNCDKGPLATPCNNCHSCRGIAADSSIDVFEIDGASNNSVEQIRELRDNMAFMPNHSRYKIYIIDEVHMLSISAFNALLKSLEEPPAHILFMFATTEIRKIPITILSRCQRHDLRRIDADAITAYLNTVCAKEAMSADNASLALISRQADGSMRDALSLLDQMMAGTDGKIEFEFAQDIIGGVDRTVLFDLCGAILALDVKQMLGKVADIYKNGQDLARTYGELLVYWRDLLVIKLAENPIRMVDRPQDEIDAMAAQVADRSDTYLIQIFELLYREEVTVRLSTHPRMAVEMVLLKLGQTPPTLPIDTLIERLDQLKVSLNQTPSVNSFSQPSGISPKKKSPPDQSRLDSSAALPSTSTGSDSPPKPAPADMDANEIWADICHYFEDESPPLAASLKNSRLIITDANRWVIEINGGEFNQTMVGNKKNRARIEKELEKKFGSKRTVEVRIHSQLAKTENRDKTESKRLKDEALNHPAVAEALEIFKGTIDKVTIIKEENR